jgi:GT2 family glycosyltransferase
MKAINTYIVPTLNNVDGLIKLVETLYKYTPHNFKIISVFNGTEEDYQKAKAVIGDRVHIWVRPHRNLGFGKSMNQGIKLATTEFVTIANDDVEIIYPEWWEEVMQVFEENPGIGGFNPHSFINKAHTGDRVCQYEIKDEYTQEDIAKMKEIFRAERWYVGCCTYFTICKRAMFDKIGLFDESFGLGSGEDYDLCVRAAHAGYLIAGGSKVMVKHWWGATKDNLPNDPAFTSNYDLIAQGNQHMERKWGPHIDEVRRRLAHLTNPENTHHTKWTQEQAEAVKGGWSVSGTGGPDAPYDKDTVEYPDGKWFQEVEL